MIEKANNENSNFKNHPFLKKTKTNSRQQAFSWVFFINIWDLFTVLESERIVSLPDANLTMDVKTYGQILENTHNCTVSSGPVPYVR